MRITTSDIKTMVRECVKKTMLNEITMSAAYDRYYKDKIPAEAWEILAQSTNDMTPYHRKAIDLIAKEGNYQGNAVQLAKMVSDAWINNPQLKNEFCNVAKNNNIEDIISFMVAIKGVERNGTKAQQMEKGLVKIFENDKLLITCTTSYSASHKYYADSRWCTASGPDGAMDGFEMFKRYTGDDWDGEFALCQFIDKKNRESSCQAQISVDKNDRFGDICNFQDGAVREDYFVNSMNASYGIDLMEILNGVDWAKLIEETEENCEKEAPYWSRKSEEFVSKAENELWNGLQSEKFIKEVKKLFLNGVASEVAMSLVSRHDVFKSSCGNIALQIGIDERSDPNEKMPDIFSKNVSNYLARVNYTHDTPFAALDIVYFFNPKGGLIKTIQGAILFGSHNFLKIMQGDYEYCEDPLYINMQNCEIMDVNDDEYFIDENKIKKDKNYVEVFNSGYYGEHKLVAILNTETCEFQEVKEGQGNVQITQANIQEMVKSCLRRLLK